MKEISSRDDKNNVEIPGTLICIDPGTAKSGIAVMRGEGTILEKKVVPTEQLAPEIGSCIRRFKTDIILMGNGTHSRKIRPMVKKAAGEIPLKLVDEKHSTEKARVRYFKENPPRGLWKLIPVTLQVPKVPIDDYAAIIVAEDYIKNIEITRNKKME